MKKLLLSTLLLCNCTLIASAGDKIKLGIKLTPCLSFSKVTDKKGSDSADFSQNGSALRMIIGPFADFTLNDNVTFTTGLWYSPRAIFLSSTANGIINKSQYNLQYLMVPGYFKFYTNEVAHDMRLYFTLGGTLDFKIAEKKVGDDNVGLKDPLAVKEGKPLFNFMDASIQMATGVEFNLKDVTNLFVGISYNRGLLNILNPFLKYNHNGDSIKPYEHLSIKNNMLSLDLGVKF